MAQNVKTIIRSARKTGRRFSTLKKEHVDRTLPSDTHVEEILPFSQLRDKEIASLLNKYHIGLTVEEAKKIRRILKRDPTLTEVVIWGIQGSEHSSYKSSKRHLKLLPTQAPNVMLGPSEDSGIIEIARTKKERFGIVMAHESHNHPSQVVPYEGSATGVGGIVRDVLCMGAHVIAIADPLRFGDIKKAESLLTAEGVVDGIGGYGNPIGVPNIAGDVYFDKSFNDNCLVNVVALGLLEEKEIIHSRAPKGAGKKGYDIIIVGKPTDRSGMGGAAFASKTLREQDKGKNKGAVQEPNPFLKRHILESTYELFRILKDKKLIDDVGFKDLGAGGVMCASFCWIVPPRITQMVLDHYNKRWAFSEIATGAGAGVIGKVTSNKNYVLRYKGAVVCEARAQDICEALLYNRPFKPRRVSYKEPRLSMPRDLEKVFLQLLSHENIASRKPIFESYDKNVQGSVLLEAGQADAGVILPFLNRADADESLKKIAVSLSVDGNPRYGKISPYWQAVNANPFFAPDAEVVGRLEEYITGHFGKRESVQSFRQGFDSSTGDHRDIGAGGRYGKNYYAVI
ncbi:MAG: Phosphoribosylformylglycinamidine synthase 2 [Candidatus Peregrinibacteria bacterium GW2011_GWA2_47_7]|nr:MAG: Phosphoribosylformylglycinamidine synthase 2 [Candidatus Peregrinibacteria bacterium GW2011_GWA2_47_7]